MKHDLCEFEIELLRHLDGRPQKANTITGWGAGVGVGVECLKGRGFAVMQLASRGGEQGYEYVASAKGRELLDQIDGPRPA